MLLPDPKLVEVSIRHIIPEEQKIDDVLIRKTTQYYNQSIKVMGKLPSVEEQERLHICAYIAVENLKSRLSIKSKILLNQIALPSKKSQKIMDEIARAIKKSNNSIKVKKNVDGKSLDDSMTTENGSKSKLSKSVETLASAPTRSTPVRVKRIVLSVNEKTPSLPNTKNIEKDQKKKDQYMSISDDDSSSDMVSEIDVNGNDGDNEEREYKKQISSFASKSNSTPLSSTTGGNNEMLNSFTKSPKKRSGRSLIDKLVAASSTENSIISNNSTFIDKTKSPKKRKRLSTSTLISDTMSASPDSSQILSSPEIVSDLSSIAQNQAKSFLSPFRVNSKPNSAIKSIFNSGDRGICLSPPAAELLESDYESDESSLVTRTKRTKHRHSPLKSSPLKSERSHHITSNEQGDNIRKKVPTTVEIVNICNVLKIPKESTIRIILEYRNFEKRIKEKWGLICGLIISIYTYIFRKFLVQNKFANSSNSYYKLNLKQRLYNEIWKWQRGELTQKDIQAWHSFAIEMIGADKLKEFYDLNNCDGKQINDAENAEQLLNDLEAYLSSSGRMIDPKFDFLNAYYSFRYSKWANSINKKIQRME